MLRDFFLGVIKIHILYHASRQEIYGLEMKEELERHGYRISPGTLYPALHGLEAQKLLESRRATIQGRVRRLYRVTAAGQQALEDAKEKIRELVGEILYEDQPPGEST